MNGHFEYKGYIGSAEIDVEGDALVGQLLFIRDTIAYSAKSIKALQKAFRSAVDDYLETCAEEGEQPDVPCKGSFNVRVGPERHRKVAIAARIADMGLNEYVCAALDDKMNVSESVTLRDVVYLSAGVSLPSDSVIQSTPEASSLGTVSVSTGPSMLWVKRGSTAH